MVTEADPTTNIREAASGQPTAGIEADDSIDDQGYAQSTSTSYVTSIASDIRRGVEENGRLYASYGRYKPMMPIDESELDRNDLQHCKFTLLQGGRLHLSPISSKPHKILDLGTGSGIWALDIADKYESASVTGVDIAPVQPVWVAPNLQFEIEDVESDWLWSKDSFDLIYGREMILSIRDWPKLIRQSFTHLKPGGYLELAGSVPMFTSDDGTLSEGTAYVEMGQVYFDIAERIGASGKTPLRWKSMLEEAGFEDVAEIILKIPTNPWPKDKRLKQIGAFELAHFRDGVKNVFARGYTQVLGGDPNYFEVRFAQAREEVLNRKMHSYLPFYVVYGKKPEKAADNA